MIAVFKLLQSISLMVFLPVVPRTCNDLLLKANMLYESGILKLLPTYNCCRKQLPTGEWIGPRLKPVSFSAASSPASKVTPLQRPHLSLWKPWLSILWTFSCSLRVLVYQMTLEQCQLPPQLHTSWAKDTVTASGLAAFPRAARNSCVGNIYTFPQLKKGSSDCQSLMIN